MPPFDNVTKDNLAIEAIVEDDWDLQDILCSRKMYIQSSLCNNFSIIQRICRLYGLDMPVDAVGYFCTALHGLSTISRMELGLDSYLRRNRQNKGSRLIRRANKMPILLIPHCNKSLHVSKGSLLMLGPKANATWRRGRKGPRQTGTFFMLRLGIVFLCGCCWMKRVRSTKAWSVLWWISGRGLAMIKLKSILRGGIFFRLASWIRDVLDVLIDTGS